MLLARITYTPETVARKASLFLWRVGMWPAQKRQQAAQHFTWTGDAGNRLIHTFAFLLQPSESILVSRATMSCGAFKRGIKIAVRRIQCTCWRSSCGCSGRDDGKNFSSIAKGFQMRLSLVCFFHPPPRPAYPSPAKLCSPAAAQRIITGGTFEPCASCRRIFKF